MHFNTCFVLTIAGLAGSAMGAKCTANKLIDNFSAFATRNNSLQSVSGDDNSMQSISATGTTLTFTPKAGSYFYENFPCTNAVADSYNAVSFTLGGPAQASFLLEVQTRANCDATSYTSTYRNVSIPTTTSAVTVPLADFAGAGLTAITSFTWSTFTKTGSPYTISNVQLVCAK